MQASSIEDKHIGLVEGIFNYNAVAYDTKEKKRSCKKRQSKIARKLRKAKEMKNDARRELAIAKKANSFSSEQIMSLAQNFGPGPGLGPSVLRSYCSPLRSFLSLG